MGSVNFPELVRTAASSGLGILSLLILVVAFIAWRFFQRSGDKVKLGVFAMLFAAMALFGVAMVQQGNAGTAPSVGSSPPPGPAQAAPKPSGKPASVAGRWQDEDGFIFDFRQRSTAIDYTAYKDGKPTGAGMGSIAGDQLSYRYRDDFTTDTGSCTARLTERETTIEGRCTSGTSTWSFRIIRAR